MTTKPTPDAQSNLAELFDANYYAQGCGAPYERSPIWLSLQNKFADHILPTIAPKSMLDAGCAIGLLVETLRGRGVDAWGIDISEYAISQVPEALKPYCRVHSVTQPFGRHFDLIVCIEVLEHMPQPQSEAAVANLCRHSDDILFSSSPDDFKEPTHFNVQPPAYWAEQFARHGFYRDVDFDASFITPWAARFRKRERSLPQLARDYERAWWTARQTNEALDEAAKQYQKQVATQAAAQAASQAAAQADTINRLQAERDAAQAEVQRLQDLVQRYEQGRLMQLMRRLKGQ